MNGGTGASPLGLSVLLERERSFILFKTLKGEAWLVTFTTALRAALPEPYVSALVIFFWTALRAMELIVFVSTVTHAPVAPWFTDDTTLYPGGGYLHVNAEVGSLISWYNVQVRP